MAPSFADVPKRHLRSIAKVTGVREFDKGASIIREGDPGSTFYVLLDGRAKVVRGGRTVTHLSARVLRGVAARLRQSERSALS